MVVQERKTEDQVVIEEMIAEVVETEAAVAVITVVAEEEVETNLKMWQFENLKMIFKNAADKFSNFQIFEFSN